MGLLNHANRADEYLTSLNVPGAQLSQPHQVAVDLKDPYVSWRRASSHDGGASVFARGYAAYEGVVLEGQALAEAALALFTSGTLKGALTELNGHWGIVAVQDGVRVVAATDRMRGVPVFYSVAGGRAIVSARPAPAHRFRDTAGIDEVAAVEYLLSGCVAGEDTLYTGIKQLRPGQFVQFEAQPNGRVQATSAKYYFYEPTSPSSLAEGELTEHLGSVCQAVVYDAISAAGSGRVVIPLSGGLDSRMIAALVKRSGVDDALCYSFGVEGKGEDRIARDVAHALGFEWQFVPYDAGVWARTMRSDEMRMFWDYAANGTSSPWPHDFPAILSLLEQHRIPDQSVFFPGHTADVIAGSHIPRRYRELQDRTISAEEVAWTTFYNLWYDDQSPRDRTTLSLIAKIRQKIRTLTLEQSLDHADLCPLDSFERFEAETRQALLILNSTRAYEVMGHRWRSLWDSRLMDFFRSVPVEMRLGRRLYIDALREEVFRGKAAKLREIPVFGYGNFDETLTLRCMPKPPLPEPPRWPAAVKRFLRQAIVPVSAWKAYNRVLNPEVNAYANDFHTWFTDQRDPRKVYVSDILTQRNTLQKLPPATRPFVNAHSRRRVDKVFCGSLLAAIVLGEMCAAAGSNH